MSNRVLASIRNILQEHSIGGALLKLYSLTIVQHGGVLPRAFQARGVLSLVSAVILIMQGRARAVYRAL